jgi:MoxR-like ATPase
MKPHKIQNIIQTANSIIHGKETNLTLVLCCVLARGHLLIEDQPGMGKTTLIKTLSKLLGLRFSRIQFTSDLLPTDILGVSIFSQSDQRFHFQPGPIFSELILGDELNRASPRTQSACLQAMEEREITVDGITHSLSEPFLFFATQNPGSSRGTNELPESQLDRFLMRISLGFPDEKSELKLLAQGLQGNEKARQIESLPAQLTVTELLSIQKQVELIHASDAVLKYILRLTRESRSLSGGLSPRAGLDLLRASKAWAFMQNRDFIIPEDIQAIAPSVMNHRIENFAELLKNVSVD